MTMRLALATGIGATLLCSAALAQRQDSPLINSPWPISHAGHAKQASTALVGPTGSSVAVQRRFFKEDAGEFFGTSPFHVIGSQRYRDAPNARALWGASLTHVYKYIIDGDRFAYVDSAELSRFPVSVAWNLFGLSGPDRIVVPSPFGLRVRSAKGSVCAGKTPALLIYADGESADSPLACVGKFEFTAQRLNEACGFRRAVLGTTGVSTGVMPGGEVVIMLSDDRGFGRSKKRETYAVVINNALTDIVTCERIGETSTSNAYPSERVAPNRTRLYLATEIELLFVDYVEDERRIEVAARMPLPLRGRTGTTPTLFDAGGDRFVILVDARCAVAKVFTGEIRCSKDATRGSQLVAVRRDPRNPEVIVTDLPAFIDTVENSPAVWREHVVVANYTGYTPDGKRDGKPDVARGIVKLSWNPSRGRFDIDWQRSDLQISGVPTISGGAGLVYSSGAEDDGQTYFYGLALDDAGARRGGDTVVRVAVGPAFETERKARDQVFDAGNNTLINDDGSAIFPGGEVLVRIR
ncbi:MAG: hypothetical protein AAFX44_13265 [Pseudomonadota bacterium]